MTEFTVRHYHVMPGDRFGGPWLYCYATLTYAR